MMTLQDLILLVNIRTGAWKNFAENYRKIGHVLSKRFAGPALIGFFTGTVKDVKKKCCHNAIQKFITDSRKVHQWTNPEPA
jgi:protein involved in ribonucleotide reduction